MEPCLRERELNGINEEIGSLYSSLSEIYTRVSELERKNTENSININNIKDLFADIKETIKELKSIIFAIFAWGFGLLSAVIAGIIIFILTR